MLFCGFVLITVAIIWTGCYLIQSGLREPTPGKQRIILGAVALTTLVLFMISLGGGWTALYFFYLATPPAIVGAVWMLGTLEGRRKAAAALVGLLFPLALFFGFELGQSLRLTLGVIRTYEKATECTLLKTVDALGQYHTDYRRYPASLAELYQARLLFPRHPTGDTRCDPYVRDWRLMPDKGDVSRGWLYSVSKGNSHYILAYWENIPNYGTFVAPICAYSSSDATVKCAFTLKRIAARVPAE
jgi:hypothetical protein